ncbi:MAG: parallel beta-helix domain-containing protein [Planctomycetaceae bacterium]
MRKLVGCDAVLLLFALLAFGISSADEPTDGASPVKTVLSPSADVQYQFQAALINAAPGDTIELQPGTYRFDSELDIACDNLTIRGAGPDATILSFKGQQVGSSGIVSTGNAFVIEDLAVEDTAGNAIKTLGARDVTFRNVRVEWTDGPKSTNGAYGIYPVECQNVLIENCTSIAASDAGIYVGQSKDVIVKGCVARRNVAGIEIENTLRADVFDNIATDNTGGILVFDLPGLNVVNGGQVRVFRNQVRDNNHPNFAPKGTMVADVPSGTGIMLMATDNVEIFDNDITGHQTTNVLVVSFLITERKINDPNYDPFPEAVSIHDNRIADGGARPSGKIGMLLGPALGGRLPDIFFDGVLNPAKLVNGALPEKLRLSVRNNGSATFTNVRIAELTPANLFAGKYKPETDAAAYDVSRKPLPAAKLSPHAPPATTGSSAVAVYRAAPNQLSEWKLFQLRDNRWQPAADLLPYELNTPLFSDYTIKHRYIRLPNGQSMTWHDTDVLNFPVGTLMAKTFSYPDPRPDQTPGERYLETRIEFRENSGWYGYSYVWNEEQTDAALQLGGAVIDVSWKDDAGQSHETQYQIPNANQCLSCHSRDAKYVPIGPTARNLNGPCSDGSGRNQLATWVAQNALTDAPAESEWPRLAQYDAPESGSLDQRARAWLEVNCAHCHNPSGSARTSGLDLTSTQDDPGKFGVFKSPVAAGKGSGGRRYDVIPGQPDQSILLYRLETDEPGARMPSLARSMTHPESNRLIREWIQAMPQSPQQK